MVSVLPKHRLLVCHTDDWSGRVVRRLFANVAGVSTATIAAASAGLGEEGVAALLSSPHWFTAAFVSHPWRGSEPQYLHCGGLGQTLPWYDTVTTLDGATGADPLRRLLLRGGLSPTLAASLAQAAVNSTQRPGPPAEQPQVGASEWQKRLEEEGATSARARPSAVASMTAVDRVRDALAALLAARMAPARRSAFAEDREARRTEVMDPSFLRREARRMRSMLGDLKPLAEMLP